MALLGCESNPPRTSANASPEEVTFLKLPDSVTEIQYWDDGHSKIARFKITESEFISLFSTKSFTEIDHPIKYEIDVFGDPSKPPRGVPNHGAATAEIGLIYQLIEKNGGGETILYDRHAGVGFYDYAPW